MIDGETTYAARYAKLEKDRQPYLDRARDCAKLTIPSLLPPDGHSDSSDLPTPYQSVGARGLNNLASKVLLALLPPNTPFFRLGMTDKAVADLTNDLAAKAKVEEALGKVERTVVHEVETTGIRSPAFEALKHAINGGNALLGLLSTAGARVYPLDQYVVVRDPEGTLLEVIVKEEVAPEALPQEVRDQIDGDSAGEEAVDLYTRMWLQDDKYHVDQQVAGIPVEGSKGIYPKDKPPFLALRWTRIDGESYGRGYIEEYLGDLISLEGLSKSIVEAAAIAAKIVFLVRPNSTVKVKELSKAENGDFVVCEHGSVQALQVDKHADMRIARESSEAIERRLAHAFLMNTAIQRQGERVTAEEIRFMAGELEDALGGVYSILSQEFQLPLVARLMARMERQGTIPKLPKEAVSPTIVTGLEALGRGHDLQKLNLFINTVGELGDEARNRINLDNLITRIGTGLGIDMEGLVKTQADLQADQEQQDRSRMTEAAADMASKATPAVAKAVAEQAAAPPNA